MSSDKAATGRCSRILGSRWAPLILAGIAVTLALPALRAGILGDDYFHRMVLLDIGEWGALTEPVPDLFSFVPPTLSHRMMEWGWLPWWTHPGIRIALARPVTALTHVLDYRLWPDDFALQHLHSLLWFGLAVGLVALLYRRLLPSPVVAGVAGLLFALEDAHAMAAGWLANRNALLCLVFGTLLILVHVRWRRQRELWQLLLGLGLLAVGLGCGEATLGALAYVVAWQLTRDRGSWRRRLTALIPYGGVVVVWRLVYDGLGYGTVGSSLYIDPGKQPVTFLGALLERWPLLLAAQWFQAPVDAWLALPRSAQVLAALLAAGLTVLLLMVLGSLLRAQPNTRFWAIGMALSLVPLCAAFPMDRLLLFAGIGAFGLLASFLESEGVWFWDVPGPGGWKRPVAVGLLLLHGPLAALALVGRVAALPLFGEFFKVGARSSPGEPGVESQTFVYINGNDFPVVYTPIIRTVEGSPPAPRRVVQLSSMATDNEVLREDDQTLLITPVRGFLAYTRDRLLANPDRRFNPGEVIERPDYVAQIRTTTPDGRPAQVAFRFRVPLGDPSLRFLYWANGKLLEFPLPRIGEKVTVEASTPI